MKYYDLFLVNKVTMTGMNLGIFTILFLQEWVEGKCLKFNP